jgi:hypothetical protein
MSSKANTNPNYMASLILLVSWEVWSEHTTRVFHNKHTPWQVVFDRIKFPACLWVLVGPKRSGDFKPGK